MIQTGSVGICHCKSRTWYSITCKRIGLTLLHFPHTILCTNHHRVLTETMNTLEYIQAIVNNLSNYSHLAMAYNIFKCGEQMRAQTQSRSDLICIANNPTHRTSSDQKINARVRDYGLSGGGQDHVQPDIAPIKSEPTGQISPLQREKLPAGTQI